MKKYAANHFEELTWITKPFNTRAFHKGLLADEQSGRIKQREMNRNGWMFLDGNRGTVLVDRVFHNGNFYKRIMPRKSGWTFGSKAAYESHGIKCTFLNTPDVIRMALKRNEIRRILRKSDGRVFEVAMLSTWADGNPLQACACIYVENGTVNRLNPEPTGKNSPEVRFVVISRATSGKMLQTLRKILKGTSTHHRKATQRGRPPRSSIMRYPEELPAEQSYSEGVAASILVNRYERNVGARKQCIRHYHPRCSVCQMSFGETYGSIGRGFIHVHHIKPLATIRTSYEVDPIKDLRPICPNCHAMVHSGGTVRSIAALRAIFQKYRSAKNERRE